MGQVGVSGVTDVAIRQGRATRGRKSEPSRLTSRELRPPGGPAIPSNRVDIVDGESSVALCER